jgi:peptidoglycan/LPS O-acetylase OafA/YrhL
MFSIRNVGGVSLCLFGTTFLWLTPMFAASDVDTSGAAWATTAFLASTTIIGFVLATWGLFRRTDWWEPLGVACAVAGLVTLIPYWSAADGSGVVNPMFDVVIHAGGSLGVLVLLRVPQLEKWVHGHVATGH